MKKGIDVSYYQGNIDWVKVKNSGIEFAILRAGLGQNGIDTKFHEYAKKCNEIGLPIGVYWFSYALNEDMARAEANYCLAAIRDYKIEYPVYWDYEYDSVEWSEKQGVKPTKALINNMLNAFCLTIEQNGYYAGNYTNGDYVNKYFAESMKRFDTWGATWTAIPNFNKPPLSPIGMWQYWNAGKVDGISGNVDMNVAYKDYPTLIRSLGMNNLDKETVNEKLNKVTAERDALAAKIKQIQKIIGG